MFKSFGKTIATIEPSERVLKKNSASFHSQRSGGVMRQILRKPTRYLESFRNYIHGDPATYIDWKLYAKTESLYIREYKEQSTSFVKIVVDLSKSMHYPGKLQENYLKKELVSKSHLATRLALNLSYNYFYQGDVVDLFLFDEEGLRCLRFKSQSEVMGIYRLLLKQDFSAIQNFAEPADSINGRKYRIGYFSSDLINISVDRFFAEENYKFAIQTLSVLETDLDWVEKMGKYKHDDSSRIEFDGKVLEEEYLPALNAWKDEISKFAKARRIHYFQVSDNTDIDDYGIKLAEVY